MREDTLYGLGTHIFGRYWELKSVKLSLFKRFAAKF